MTAWPSVPLAELLLEQKERIGTIDADGMPLLGVNNKNGLQRSDMPRIPDMSRYLRVEKGWFAYNPMRVNVGSVGWAHSETLVGAISPDYVVFSCTPKIDPELLYWFLTSAPGLREINMQTAGSVRERLYFASLAKVIIPLPPIQEQRRIVNQLAALSKRISAVLRLKRESEALLQALCRSMILFSEPNCQSARMSEIVSLRQPDTKVERHQSYTFAGVYCFGKGVFKGQTKSGTEFAYDRLTQIRAGEFTYPKLMAWEGALGVVPDDCDGLYVSPSTRSLRLTLDGCCLKCWSLDVFFRTPSVWPTLGEVSTGTNVLATTTSSFCFSESANTSSADGDSACRIRQVRRAVEGISAMRRKSEAEVKALLSAVIARAFDGRF